MKRFITKLRLIVKILDLKLRVYLKNEMGMTMKAYERF